MELCYRGQRYEYNPTAIKVSQKSKMLKFRGCDYQLNSAVINVSSSNQSQVVYRGVSVATGKEIKFLGQYCDHKQIILTPIAA